MRHAFAAIWAEGAQAAVKTGSSSVSGGIRAWWRGVDATTVRGIVLSVSQICSYDQIKQTLKRKGVMEEGLSLHFVASMVAGYVYLRSTLSRKLNCYLIGCSALSLQIQWVRH